MIDHPEPVEGVLLEAGPDRVTTLAVIVVLGLVAIATVVGGIFLAANDKSIPDALIAIGSAAAGSVGTLLARGR